MTRTSIAYLKEGDVIRELDRFGSNDAPPVQNGPFIYSWGLLHHSCGRKTLLLSLRFQRCSRTIGNAQALILPYKAPGAFSVLKKLAISFELFALLLRRRPKVFLCALAGPPLWLARLAAKLLGSTFIYIRHSVLKTGLESGFKAFQRDLDNSVIKSSDIVIAHGSFLLDALRSIGVAEDKLHHYWLPLTDYAASQDAPPLPFTPPKRFILNVGRLVEEKGIFDLLEAAQPLLAEDPKLHLIIGGDGPAEDRLHQAVQESPVAKQIIVPGRIANKSLHSLMRQSLFLVAPTRQSLSEGRCMTIFEALASGIPVVAPNYGAFSHYLDQEKNALLYEPDSVPAMSAAMRRILTEPDLHAALCTQARKTGETYLAPSPTYMETIRSILEQVGMSPAECPENRSSHR